jgi:N6-L-threonylcarbamoyladenine synthase
VLSEKRLSFAETQRLFKGICPHVSAQLHRSNIDRLVDECVEEAGIRISDLDAIASTVKPGIVLCLKVGADKALALCR